MSTHVLKPAISAVVLLVSAFSVALPCAADEPLPARHTPTVSFPKNCNQEQAIQALRRGSTVPIVAEIPALEHRLEQEHLGLQLDQALETACLGLNLYYRQRPGSLALPKRYIDFREPLDLELTELREIASDLFKVIGAAAPYPLDITLTLNQNKFIKTLSRRQIDAMRAPAGLPIGALTPEQQTLWTSINMSQAYSGAFDNVTHASLAFGAWPRSELVYLPTLTTTSTMESLLL
jgi:hypothetical protein